MKTSTLCYVANLAILAIVSPALGATVNLPDVVVTSLGHSHFYDNFEGESYTHDRVDIPSGSGEFTTTPFVGEVTNGDTVVQKVVAAPGYKFSVERNFGFISQQLGLSLYWQAGGDVTNNFPTLSVTFENLTGIAPTPISTFSGFGDAGNSIAFSHSASVTDDFSFTGITLSFTAGHTPSVSGDRTFNIGSNSSPSFYAFGFAGSDFDAVMMSLTPIPEPTGLALAGCGAMALFARRRRK